MQLPGPLLFKEWATEKESENETEKEQSKGWENTGRSNVLKSVKGKSRGGKWESIVIISEDGACDEMDGSLMTERKEYQSGRWSI